MGIIVYLFTAVELGISFLVTKFRGLGRGGGGEEIMIIKVCTLAVKVSLIEYPEMQ